MRDLATEPKAAYKLLGPESGKNFISLLADFRAATFAGDLPTLPVAIGQDGTKFAVDWSIGENCALRTTLDASRSAGDAWKDVRRIQIEAIQIREEVHK